MRRKLTPYRTKGDAKGVSAALLVLSTTLDCDGVGLALGLEPTERTPGDPASPHEFRKAAAWALSSAGRVASPDLRDHIDWLLEQLFPAKAKLADLREREGVDARLSFRYPHSPMSGPVLWPRHLKALADLGLEVSFAAMPEDCPSPRP